MGNKVINQAAKFLRERHNTRRWIAIVLCLALVVTSGTFSALTREGHALSDKNRKLECTYKAHEHGAECYNEAGETVCGFADYCVHTHNEACGAGLLSGGLGANPGVSGLPRHQWKYGTADSCGKSGLCGAGSADRGTAGRRDRVLERQFCHRSPRYRESRGGRRICHQGRCKYCRGYPRCGLFSADRPYFPAYSLRGTVGFVIHGHERQAFGAWLCCLRRSAEHTGRTV